jgi:hypothetical protein
LAQSTVRLHRWYIAQFLERFWQQKRSFDSMCIRDIDAAIARKGEQQSYCRTSIAHYVGALRVLTLTRSRAPNSFFAAFCSRTPGEKS